MAITTRWWYYQGGHKAGFPCIYNEYNFYTLECYELQCFIYVLHFQSKIWVKPAREQSFLHGNRILKSGFGRITENTPQYQGVIVYSMNDLPLVSEKKLSSWREILYASKWDGIPPNVWKYSTVNPLKSEKVLIPLYNLFLESIHKNKGNDQQLRQLLMVLQILLVRT